MSKKFKILILLMSLSITLCIMSNTYSKYAADTTGNIEVSFAKWQILVNNQDITNGVARTISITPTIDTNSNVAANKLAPSSTGYFDIDIDPSNVELSYNYSISLDIDNEDMPDVMITQYAILDSDYEEGDQIVRNNIVSNTISGTQNYTNAGFEPFTVRVYFGWFEGDGESMNDAADTAVGHAAINAATDTIEISATIRFDQKLS